MQSPVQQSRKFSLALLQNFAQHSAGMATLKHAGPRNYVLSISADIWVGTSVQNLFFLIGFERPRLLIDLTVEDVANILGALSLARFFPGLQAHFPHVFL